MSTPRVSIFRKEHLDHFETLQGMKIPGPARVLAWLLCILVVVMSAFLAVTPWVQTTSGPGFVTALDPQDRVQDISALIPGRIQEWYVSDGTDVKAGDPIVRLVDIDPKLLDRLLAEQQAVERQLQAARTAVQTAELNYERTKRLYDDGLAARVDFENARITLEDLKSKEAAAQAELNRVSVSLSRQSSQLVTAPRNGTILRVKAGDVATLVDVGQPLATFIPADARQVVELYIDGRDIALVKPGRQVRLQFEGWPAIQFSGWPSLAVGTFGGEVVFVEPSAMPDGRFRVLVKPDPTEAPWPDQQFIRFGAKARGWILLDTVPLAYELWRQLNSFPPNFAGVPASQNGPMPSGNGGSTGNGSSNGQTSG